jgi:acetyl esterase/lipase
MLYTLLFVGLVLAGLYLYLHRRAAQHEGEDLSRFDSTPALFASASPSKGMDDLKAYIDEMFGASTNKSSPAGNGWEHKRDAFEAAGLARDYDGVEFRYDIVDVNGREMIGAWTLLPNSDATRRLLYMHGGAFTVGSDISHRPLTVQLARRTGMAVFTPNYRLMPEHTRRDIIEDARAAYAWIIENDPNGPAPLSKFAIAGDSAGGNLALMLGNWARHHSEHQADAIVAFSPTVDATLASPSMKRNLATDDMLRPLLAPILKIPRLILLPEMAKRYGMSPADPEQSPIFDNLSNLPPTLIQASASEMLHDESVRFAAKAQAAESLVSFQSWGGGLPHVWQIFDTYLPEADAALDEIEKFLANYT